ncbi:MAG: hypothetical protein HY907_14770 [Deltaproteobacteria bacterium]|nr:hypothetical protein [Deltaproteobacteria bacterium]
MSRLGRCPGACILLICACAGNAGSRRPGDAGPGPDPADAVADVADGAEVPSEARCPADQEAGFARCNVIWKFGSRAGMSLLGGALVGDTAGLLGTYDSHLFFWIVARDGRVIAWSLDARAPAERQPINEPLLAFRAIGAVAAVADRFVVAFGGTDEQWLWVWVRAFLPPTGVVPFDSVGDTDWTRPALLLPNRSTDRIPRLDLFPFRDFAVVGVVRPLGRGVVVVAPVTTTITGAPAPFLAAGFFLFPDLESGGWTMSMASGGDEGESYRFLGPLGRHALGVKGRRLLLQPSAGLTTRFQFGDGWEPEREDVLMQAPDRLVRRIEPREFDGAAGCGVRLIAYDLDGHVASRTALPAGYQPVASGGGTADVLAADETDVVLCASEASVERAVDVPWREAAKKARLAPREPPSGAAVPAEQQGVEPREPGTSALPGAGA